MSFSFENEIVDLLVDLAKVQGELLEHLAIKRELITKKDEQALVELQTCEAELVSRLSECHDRRKEILERAQGAGIQADSVLALSEALPEKERDKLLPFRGRRRRTAPDCNRAGAALAQYGRP